MKKLLFSVVFVSFCGMFSAKAQTLYVPGGTVGTSSNGSVGIGTSTPYFHSKLHIEDGAIRIYKNSGFGGSNGGWGRTNHIHLLTQYTDKSLYIGFDGNNFYMGREHGGMPLVALSLDVSKVMVENDLEVDGSSTFADKVTIGAGVNTPAGYKLYVQDGILTEKIKVAVKNSSNWADFVFAKDYQLKSLDEVETYINENKHLPDVPSAEEVVESGIDVAQMDALLLQKIEELTLYVIQLKAELKALKQ